MRRKKRVLLGAVASATLGSATACGTTHLETETRRAPILAAPEDPATRAVHSTTPNAQTAAAESAPAAQVVAPTTSAVPKPQKKCTWKVGNGKVPPCRDDET